MLAHNRIVIITCITNEHDLLKPIPTNLPCCVVCDKPPEGSKQWVHKKTIWPKNITDPLRARLVKCMPHRFVSADISIWVDASLQFKRDPREYLEKIGDAELATYKHPARNCAFEEARKVIRKGKAPPRLVMRQIHQYQHEGFPENTGLAATGVVIRRHTPETWRFGEKWWQEQVTWCNRDQLSFNYTCWKEDMPWTVIPGNLRWNEFFQIKHHKSKWNKGISVIRESLSE